MTRSFIGSNLLIPTVLISLLLFSCRTVPENVIYFENNSSLPDSQLPINQSDPVLQPNDLISILVSSPVAGSAQSFNLGQSIEVAEGGMTDSPLDKNTQSRPGTYLIDSKGNIEFPTLGTVNLAGLTRIEAKEALSEKLKSYIIDPIVSVRITNFQITVLGEVNQPGVYLVPNERVTIVDALGLAGDMTITGKRGNILVRRDMGNYIKEYRLDITSPDISKSPAYFLKQNDVVYIEPNDLRVKSSEGNRNVLPIVISIVGVLLTMTNIILRF